MGKKTNFNKNSSPTVFSWAKDTNFTPPKISGHVVAQNKNVPPTSVTGNLKQIFEHMLGSIVNAVNSSGGIIRIFSPHAHLPQLISSPGLPVELMKAENSAHLNCEICGKASIGRGIYSIDLSACNSRHGCKHAGCKIQTLTTAPIENRAELKNPVGMLTLFFNETPESFDQLYKTVLAFVEMLNAVIEHNKSIREAKRISLIDERQAIANEIHDSLAQTLVFARMCTSMLIESIKTGNEIMVAKYSHDIDETLESSQKIVRELITDFRCAMDPSGLLHALQTLTRQFSQRSKISLEYINRVANLDLPLEYEIQVYHIIQEALSNIATHSEATHARLILEHSENFFVFTIDDDGTGGCTFTPIEGHYGMMIMRERAHRIGGEIKVESTKGIGTRVQLYFPEPGSDWREANA